MQLHQNKLFNGTQFTENILGELNLNYSTFREGRTIYRENDPTKNIFLILEGEVNIITHEILEGSSPNSKVLSDGDFFGYDEHYYSVTRYSRAIALRDTEIVMVSMDELNNLIVKEWVIIDNLKNNIHFQLPVKKLKKSLKSYISNVTSPEEITPNISENDINRIQSEIVKAKLYAEKEIENRFSELHKKETELLKLKENLHKEKLFAEQTLQEELLELEKKEKALLLNEKSIEQVKATAEITLKNELRKLKEKEEDLQKKADIIENDKLNLNDSIEKAKELALKEIELIKKSNQISSQAKYVDEIQELKDGRTNLLFVGRLSPNKKQEDLIESFRYFQAFEPNSRLILVGHDEDSDPYATFLKKTAEKWGLEDKVIFTGKVDDAQLSAYYHCTDLFWSMSEHEGFCVPLIESMWYNVPVLAYKSTAIPETLGNAGIMFDDKSDKKQIACLAWLITKNKVFKEKILSTQRQQRECYLSEAVGKKLKQYLEQLF